MVSKLRVAAIQHDIEWENPERNFTRLAPLIAEAAVDSDLVVLSEMFATGFSMAASQLAEPADGPTERFLAEQATANGVSVAASRPALDANFARPVNQFVLVGPDGKVERYVKTHPFSYAGEHDYYDPGPGSETVELRGVRVTPFICYDLRFANEFWDRARATDVYIVVANWPASRREHWLALLRARAIENQAYVVGVNRVGDGDGLKHSGDSRIFDPLGETLAEAIDPSESILRATIDSDHVGRVRSDFPFLDDR